MIKILVCLVFILCVCLVWYQLPSDSGTFPSSGNVPTPSDAIIVEFDLSDSTPIHVGDIRYQDIVIRNNLDRSIKLICHEDLCCANACLSFDKPGDVIINPKTTFRFRIQVTARIAGAVEIPYKLHFDAGSVISRTVIYRGSICEKGENIQP